MRRLLGVLFGFAALVLVAWLALHDPGTPSEDVISTVRATPDALATEIKKVLSAGVQPTERAVAARPAERVDAVGAIPTTPEKIPAAFVGEATTGSFTGKVVSDLGLPVEAARVEAYRVLGDARGRYDWGDRKGTLGVVIEGGFRFGELKPGEWEFVSFGAMDTRSSPVTVQVPTSALDTTLVLPRAAGVAGIVQSDAGVPIPNAGLYVRYSGELAPDFFTNVPPPRTNSDESGRFLLDGLMPGTLHLKAYNVDNSQSEWTEVTVAPGESAEGLRIVIASGGRIEGVVDASLGEVAGRTLNIFSHRGTEGWLDTKSGEDGSFVFENVIPQDYIIELRAAGYPFNTAEGSASIRTRITVENGKTTEIVFRADLEIPIRGTVRANGLPLEGVQVSAKPRGSVPDRGGRNTTGADGVFELTVAGPGEFSIQAYGNQGSYYFFRVAVSETGENEFDLEVPVGRVAGTVTSPIGEPLPRVPVTLQGEPTENAETAAGGQLQRRTYTDADGKFDFRFLDPGTYTLRSPDGFWRDSPPPLTPYGRVLLTGLVIGEGSSLEDLELRLSIEGRISGTVLNNQGDPVQGALILVRDSLGRNLSSSGWEAKVDASGHFQIRSLSDGVYTVVAGTREELGETTDVRVEAEKTGETTVRIEQRE